VHFSQHVQVDCRNFLDQFFGPEKRSAIVDDLADVAYALNRKSLASLEPEDVRQGRLRGGVPTEEASLFIRADVLGLFS